MRQSGAVCRILQAEKVFHPFSHMQLFTVAETEARVQVQVVTLVVNAGAQSEIWHYFTYMSNSFLDEKNRGR